MTSGLTRIGSIGSMEVSSRLVVFASSEPGCALRGEPRHAGHRGTVFCGVFVQAMPFLD